jgi:hypothetical protein
LQPRTWNVGASYGFGGTHGFYAPSLDFSLRGTWLRFGFAPAFFSCSINQDLAYLIRTETDVLAFVAAAGYHRTNDTWALRYRQIDWTFTPVDGLHALLGIRFDCAKRLSIRYMMGLNRNHRRDQGNFMVLDRGEWRTWPTMEMGLGLRLFPVQMTRYELHESIH